jgi:hypothetical protein
MSAWVTPIRNRLARPAKTEMSYISGEARMSDGKRPDDGAHVVDRAAFARFLADVQGGVTTSS